MKEKLVEVDGWDDSLMSIQLEKFSDLARPQHLAGGYTDQREPTETEMDIFKSVTSGIDGEPKLTVAGSIRWTRCRVPDVAGG